MKLILDTNIYISALVFDRMLEKMLIEVLNNEEFDIFFSLETFEELGQKLLSDKFTKILVKSKRNLTKQQVAEFLQRLQMSARLIYKIDARVDICRDPRDNMFLELAETVEADYLITGDKDLLDLELFKQTKIIRPSDFIF